MGRPRIWRNDRFWLAIDHTVDPRNMHEATPQKLIKASESFAEEANIVDFHQPNTVRTPRIRPVTFNEQG